MHSKLLISKELTNLQGVYAHCLLRINALQKGTQGYIRS